MGWKSKGECPKCGAEIARTEPADMMAGWKCTDTECGWRFGKGKGEIVPEKKAKKASTKKTEKTASEKKPKKKEAR